MPTVTYSFDVQLSIVRSNELPPLVGFDSKFTEEPHPGTSKKIVGWKWDERVWPNNEEFLAQESVPSIWDPDNSALNPEDFQSGIGDGRDLFVNSIDIIFRNDRSRWSPSVKHGYYYDQETEAYLYSDGSTFQHFSINDTTTSGLHFVDLSFIPKPGIPISAVKWKWNNIDGKYEYYHLLRKKASFTGVRDDNGVRLPTRDESGDIVFANISDEFKEFVVESQLTPQRAIVNDDYIEEHRFFPFGTYKDQVDGSSGAFAKLTTKKQVKSW